MAIHVMVAENSHYMDERSSYELGTFESLDSAIGASKRIVDDYFKSAYRPGMTAKALFENYAMFGEDPYVVASERASPRTFGGTLPSPSVPMT